MALLILCTACGGYTPPAPAPVPSTSPTADALRPGDKVRLKIWREPDLSGDFDVGQDGRVLLPKIGAVDVGTIAADSAKHLIVGSYDAVLRNPTIDVVLLRRVNVLGAVRTPGLYPVDPTMTVADALALAGGAASDGQPDKVRVYREGQQLTISLTPGTRIGDTSIRGGDQLFVPQRSWASRNMGLVIGTTLAVTGLLIRVSTN